MTTKLNLLGGAFLLASVLGLAPARAEGVAQTPPAVATAPAAAPRVQPRGKPASKPAGKRAGKSPAPIKVETAATPAASPAPSPGKMQELQKHPEARSGRGHL